MRIGSLLQDRLNRPAQALEAFREAYEQSPGDADLAARVLALRRAVGLQLRGVRHDAENTPPRARFDFAVHVRGAPTGRAAWRGRRCESGEIARCDGTRKQK